MILRISILLDSQEKRSLLLMSISDRRIGGKIKQSSSCLLCNYKLKTEAGKWLLSEYEVENSTIQLTSINFELELSEIYSGVEFSEIE